MVSVAGIYNCEDPAHPRWVRSAAATKKRVDETQLRLLARNLAAARRDLDEAIFRSYCHLHLLGKDNKLRHVPMGQITSSSAASLVELYLRELERLEEVTAGVGPSRLVKYWPGGMVEWSTRAVRDAFYSSPQLPRLLNSDSIKRTICDGVTQGVLGYASRDSNGQLKLEKLKQSLIDTDVEIADDVYILKAEDAQKLLEPPRLARLVVRPEQQVVLKIGEQAAFSCAGVDQYGQPFPVTQATWSATGGTVTSDGLFTAGQTGGLHTVRLEVDGHEAIGEVRITTKDEPPPPPPPPGEQVIRWRGAVPTQKWMNFYTKVLTRFASQPGLKLWEFCEGSARYCFGSALGDPTADEILRALRGRGDGMTRTEIREHFQRHKGADEVLRALSVLLEHRLARCEQRTETGGRPAEVWFATGT